MHRPTTRSRAWLLPAALICAFAALASATGLAAQDDGRIRLVVAPEGNEARYLVREQLAGFDFPNDAVGRTTNVQGMIVVEADGSVVSDSSRFVIDMASLATDSDRRDNYVRRNTLETEAHPTAVFVPTDLRGLTFPLPSMGDVSFTVVGDLTIRGVTKPTTWEVTGHVMNGGISGEAKTSFTFEEFEMTKPSVRRVLSVNDDITLEYTFRLVPVIE